MWLSNQPVYYKGAGYDNQRESAKKTDAKLDWTKYNRHVSIDQTM